MFQEECGHVQLPADGGVVQRCCAEPVLTLDVGPVVEQQPHGIDGTVAIRMSNIVVTDELPDSLFTSPELVP